MTALVTALAAWLVVPRSFWSGGMDMTTLSPVDYSRWDRVRPFLPGALAFGAGLLPGDGVIGEVPVWPFYFMGTTATMVWAARAGAAARSWAGAGPGRPWTPPRRRRPPPPVCGWPPNTGRCCSA